MRERRQTVEAVKAVLDALDLTAEELRLCEGCEKIDKSDAYAYVCDNPPDRGP